MIWCIDKIFIASNTMKKFIILLLLAGFPLATLAANVQQLVQLIDYVGVDYGEAVSDGKVINPGEYGEMQDFSAAIAEQVALLPSFGVQQRLTDEASKLANLVADMADAMEVQAVTIKMRQALIGEYGMRVTPLHVPDFDAASTLYSQQCAGCHGMTGHADGPLAASLDPKPTDFLDTDRYRQRSLFGLYNTISLGVKGTAMQSFASLTEKERWSLAFFVGIMAVNPQEISTGEKLWKQDGMAIELGQLEYFATHSAEEIQQKYGESGAAIAAFLRTNPADLFYVEDRQPLDYTLARLSESVSSYQAGDKTAAYELAVRAYLEGFELVEGNIDAVDVDLRKEIESAMTGYRNLIRHDAAEADIVIEADRINDLIVSAQHKLDTTTLSGISAFVGALVILLREGLEALLVIAALSAFLIKTERSDGLVYLYAGVAGALVLGVLTWVASNTVIDITGTARELTEGFAALFAAAVLFSVGFWMHGKTSAVQWKHFIQTSLKKHLGRGTLWGLAGLSFIAVYREMFEVVLFYQALWIQASPSGQSLILSGLMLAVAILIILGWLVLRYSTRLPLRQFFAVSSVLMFVLGFVFVGKGINALQEAGKLPIDPLDFPTIELLGIYPNLQVLSMQAILLLLAAVLLLRKKPAVSTS